MVPLWVQAAFWGGVSGVALLIGALVGYFLHVPQRLIAGIMAFGSGVLISALSFNLMSDAFERGGFAATAIGFVAGSIVYTIIDNILASHGGKHRKRSGQQQQQEKQEHSNSGLAIAVGAILDGIPESIAIGVSMIGGGVVSIVAVSAIFLSNIPEGLSSAAGMRKANRSIGYTIGLWGGITLISAVFALIGYSVFSHFSPTVIAATLAIAAGAILTMLADTMLPEAFESAHNFTGLITVLGFLTAFFLSRMI